MGTRRHGQIRHDASIWLELYYTQLLCEVFSVLLLLWTAHVKVKSLFLLWILHPALAIPLEWKWSYDMKNHDSRWALALELPTSDSKSTWEPTLSTQGWQHKIILSLAMKKLHSHITRWSENSHNVKIQNYFHICSQMDQRELPAGNPAVPLQTYLDISLASS